MDTSTTLINVFTVDPANQADALALLTQGTETLIAKMPGWISTRLHRSQDGRRVVIVSEWRRPEDIAAMRQHPEMGPYFQKVMAVAQMDSTMCELTSAHHA